MKRNLARGLERLVDGFASVSFGGAVAMFAYHLPAPVAVQPLHGALAAAAALVAYGIASSLLGLVRRPLPVVTATDFESPAVVRLFDPSKAAASGQSTAWTGRRRIDLPPDAPSDASDSLHAALNQLRQSLANRR